MSITVRVILTIATCIAGTMLSGFQSKETRRPSKVYSVCEVLADLASFNGKMISVRGAVLGGQGTFLVGNCQSKLVVKGFTWPNLIWLTFPYKSSTPFNADLATYQHVMDAVKRMHPGKNDQIVLTYLGVLESDDLAKRTSLNRMGQPTGIGFGAQNMAPAQLVIKTVMDPQVIPSGRDGPVRGN